jgi:hypothetical protein
MYFTYMIFVMIFETLQHGILANEGASPPGHQICTLFLLLGFSYFSAYN